MSEERFDGLLSRTITRVRRINYVLPNGRRDTREGPIEITLDGDLTVRLESGSDGESLRICAGTWADPFAEPVSGENRQFVNESGKWSAFDVSDDEVHRSLIGQRIQDLSLIIRMGKIVGVELVVGHARVKAEVEEDELFVELLPGLF